MGTDEASGPSVTKTRGGTIHMHKQGNDCNEASQVFCRLSVVDRRLNQCGRRQSPFRVLGTEYHLDYLLAGFVGHLRYQTKRAKKNTIRPPPAPDRDHKSTHKTENAPEKTASILQEGNTKRQ